MSEPSKKPVPQRAKLLAKLTQDQIKDEAAKKAMPNLLDVLLPIWKDGTMVRQPGRMSIVPDGGFWRVTIEAPTEGLQTTLNCDSLASILGEVEKLLADGTARWGLSWSRRKKNLPVIDDLI